MADLKAFNPFENKGLAKALEHQQENLGGGELRPYLQEGFAQQHEREATPLTYADPVPEATGLKNFEKLTPFEQKLSMWMPKAVGDATALATGWMSDDLKENLKAAWGPIGQIVSPVASTVGKALMLFALPAEGVERVWGLAKQYKDAAYHGTTDAFLEDLNSAWKAAHFSYETESGLAIPWITDDGKGNLTVDFPLMGDMPGVEAQVKARQMFAAGATQEEVEAWLEQDQGAMQFRGMLNDVVMQSIFDPLWLLGGLPGLITKQRGMLGGARAGVKLAEEAKALAEVQNLADALRAPIKAAEALGDTGPLARLANAQEKALKVGDQLIAGTDAIRHMSQSDVAALVEKGYLREIVGGYEYTDEAEKALKLVAEAGDSTLAGKIADAETEIAQRKEAMEWIEAHRLKPHEEKFLRLTGGVPGEDVEKTSFALHKGSLLKPWTWFRLTPEAKTQEIISMVGNNTAGLIANLNESGDIAKTFLAAERGLASKEMGNLVLTLEGRAFKAMINGASGVVKDQVAGYARSAVERGLLENIADYLGKSVDDIMEDLGQKNGSKKVFDAMMAMAKAPTAKGTAVTGIGDMLRAGSLTLDTVDGLGKFFLDGKIPFNLDTLKLHVMGAVADLARANAVQVFGATTEGLFTKATSALKSAETLAYLRLNPGYPIRNFLNNEITMFSRGVWNSMSEKDIHRLWTHIGFEPARLGEGIGSAGVKVGKEIGEAAAKKAKINVSEAIKEAEEMVARAAKGDRNWMDKAASGINGINLGKLDGGYWAQVCERMASRRAMTGGFLQGMNWYMKKSKQVMRFEDYVARYHPDLDISGVPHDVLERLWKQTEGFLGEKDLNVLFKADLKMGFEEVVDDVAKGLGMSTDDLRDKIGDELLTRLRYDVGRAIETGDVDLLRRSFDNVSESLQDHLSGLAVNDFETYAERTAARIQAVGDPTAYLRIYGDGIDGHYAAWEGYLSRISERARDIRMLPQEKQGAAWDQFFRDSNGYFDRLFTRDEARIEGMLRAARNNGMHVPEDAIRPFRELRDATAAFNREKTALYKTFRREAPKLDPAKREAMWAKLQDQLDQSYSKLMDVSERTARDLDNVLYDAVRAQSPGFAPEIAAWRATVRELRKGYQVDVQVHYRSIASLDGEARVAAQEAFNARRLEWQNRIHMAEREGIESIESGRPFGTVRGVDQQTLNIYGKNMGVSGTFFEGKTLNERIRDYVAAGLSPQDARRMAAGDIRANTGLTAGRVDGRLAGERAWVDKARIPLSDQSSAASAGLRKLEERGESVTASHIAGLSDEIANAPERVQWLENVVAEISDPGIRKAASEVLSSEWRKMDPELFLSEEGPLLNGRWVTLSAEKGASDPAATRALEEELRALGYSPIPTRGTYQMQERTTALASAEAARSGGPLPDRVIVYNVTPYGGTPSGWAHIEPGKALTNVGDAGRRSGTLQWAEVSREEWEAARALAVKENARRGTRGVDATEGLFDQVKWRPEEELPGGVPGSYAESQMLDGGLNVESSFMVPGMTDREGYLLGKKYGQESILTKDGFVGTGGKVDGQFSRVTGAVTEETDLAKFGTEIDVGGRPVRFSLGTNTPEGPEFNELWRASMDEPQGFITLDRYTNKPGAKVLDPGDAAQRTGVPTSGRRGHPQIPEHEYYLHGTKPEDIVTQGRSVQSVSVPSDKIYDLNRDPLKLKKAIIDARVEAAKTEADKTVARMIRSVSDDELALELQKRGYWGYRNTGGQGPNVVGIYKPLEVIPPDQVGKRASMVMQNMEGQSVTSASVREALEKTFSLSPEQADKVQAAMDVRAGLWARITGKTKDDWYSTFIADVRSGLPPGAAAGAEADVAGEVRRAAVTFNAEGKAIISALEKPDVSSVIHEWGHVLRQDVASTQPELMKRMERHLGVKDGKWTRDQEERFARSLESYLKTGAAPTQELQPLFERFKEWMEAIYKALRSKRDVEEKMTPEVKSFFDDVFTDARATGMDGSLKPGLSNTRLDEMLREEPTIGQPLDELWWNDGGEILGRMRASAEKAIDEVALPGLGRAEAPDMKAAVSGYHSYMQGAMKDANRFAIKYGTMKRDASLLNYKARTYFDQGLANAMPFGFWTTHSMATWAKWSLERPAVISEWMRIKNFTETGGLNENLPQRLKGSVPITNLPFLPKWMGPLFVNPTRAMNLPFDMWVNPVEQGNQAGKAILDRTTQLIQRGMDDGTIDPQSGQQAITTRSGPVWQDASAEVAKGGEDTYDPFDAVSSLLAPHAPIVWAYHAARGTTDEIGPFLPATRTVKAVSALMGVPGGLNIEGPLRKALGLPEFDKWDEYRTERMLVNMVANQEISIDDAQAAWQTKEGEIWTQAKTRAGKEFAVGALSGMAGIPARAYPEGEQFSRELQTGLNKAYENGTERAFFEEHPEVKMRLALFDTPEDRFKTFVTDKVWDTYNSLPSLSKSTARDILGADFEAFLAGDVPAKSLDTDKAAVWLKTMGFADEGGTYTGEAAAASGFKTLKDGSQVPLRMPPPEIAKQAQSYYDLRAQKFSPVIFEYQDEYFKLKEGAERKQYLTKHPGLRAYWDWREQWFLRHPEVAPYITEKPPGLTNAQMAQAEGRPVNLSAQEWEQILGGHIYSLVMDTKNGHELPDVVITALQQKSEQYGLEGQFEHGIEQMVELILTAPR